MKIFCFDCGHRCHCEGQGFYVSTSQCSTCDCYVCNHLEVKKYMEDNMIKKLWKKIKSWFWVKD